MAIKKNTANTDNPITIGIPIYEGVDSLDVIGAFQVFFLLGPGVKVYLITEDGNPINSFEGIQLGNAISFRKCPKLDVLFVPGANGYAHYLPDKIVKGQVVKNLNNLLNNKNPYLEFLRRKAEEVTWITSVCTGSILLAAAGLLKGHRVTTHWAFKSVLHMFPDLVVADNYPRYVIDGNVITGGGISSAIDTALAISTIIAGVQPAKNAQLAMQYAPDPPYSDGNPDEADILTMSAVTNNVSQAVSDTMDTINRYLKKKN